LFTVTFGSVLIALSAQIAVFLPFSPVPITGQTLGVLMVGAALGSKRGLGAVILYLLEGSIGLPVFAGGKAGLAVLVGPTGGYLVGFLGAAFLAGLLSERGWDRNVIKASVMMLLCTSVIFAIGLPWLAIYVGFGQVLAMGFYPFVTGAIIKMAIASGLLPIGWKLLGKRGIR
jgi:biotin transport system substrate-specific component